MGELQYSKELVLEQTPIEGMFLLDLPVFGDNRGWFKENWQKSKMVTLGLPDFGPVQNNISFNEKTGVTRGLHAEPWDKYISIGSGSVFGAWCDIRENSPTFGQIFTAVLDPTKAIFIPRGVANGFQTLEDNTVYTYLVNDHWSKDAQYSNVSIFDESLGINWPIPLNEAEVSEKDKLNPNLEQAVPIKAKKVLVTGADGQLGKALRKVYPDADFRSRDGLDITDEDIENKLDWREYQTIVNAAAFTAVDAAELPEGRLNAWRINAEAVARLSKLAGKYGITLVHISSDYVFDGTKPIYTEDDSFTPVSVYGQSKAAGDLAVLVSPKHYIVRTSWVVGDGKNFVQTMKMLSDKGVSPSVVNDQFGRLTFTDTLAEGIKHLVDSGAPYGTYNISNSGDVVSWYDIAKKVYELSGRDSSLVSGVTTSEYYKDKDNIAPRPSNSVLDLSKTADAGYNTRDWKHDLSNYLKEGDS